MKPTESVTESDAGLVTKWFIILGLLAGCSMTIFDYATNVSGFQKVLGEGNGGILPKVLPFGLAMLSIAFNALTARMFRMYFHQGFTSFATMYTFCLWIFFVGMDVIWSVVGLVAWYAPNGSFSDCTSIQQFFLITSAIVICSGPFLCAVFSDMGAFDQIFQ